MNAYWCEHAWRGNAARLAVQSSVRVVVDTHGRITEVQQNEPAGRDDVRLPGLVLPGFANAHSHAFHRALRGRTGGGGTFWTWREAMYAVAGRLDPGSYLALARAAYAEMALAGVSTVGEFHYLHHGPDGQRYDDPNAMGEALHQAAAEAGVRLTLLDSCYLSGGLEADSGAGRYAPLSGVQLRFGDDSADGWASRVAQLRPDSGMRVGAAIHSVRAVPRDQLRDVATAAGDGPLHVHLSEQPAENDACRAAFGLTPTQLLAEAGALTPSTTAVHATHLDAEDIAALGSAGVGACLCPTTERDLADGIGPARALADAGSPLCLGSDQHAVVDLLEEARAMEMHERLASGQRGRFTPAELVDALTWRGHAALGWPEAGRIEVGAPADLVAVRLDTVRTAGADPAQAVLVAGAGDVDTVVVGGRVMVEHGRHVLGDVARMLSEAITLLWEDR